MKTGGYFPFPNDVIDKLLFKLTGAEFKILSVIIRQTAGWKKQWDRISTSQFQKKSGLSKPGVMVSIDVLIDNNLILCEKVNEDGKLPANWYALFGETNEAARLVRSPDQYGHLTGKAILLEMGKSVDQLGEKLVRSPYPQKKDRVKTKQQTTTVVVNIDPEPEPHPNIKSDQTIIEGAVLAKYRAQIMDRPPSQNALRDALELYQVDQLEEAIERMPAVLKDIKDGNGVLGLACKAVKNPHWWRQDDGGNGKAKPTHEEAEKARAINGFTRAVSNYRTLSPETGTTQRGDTQGYMINVMRPYAGWYDCIDNLGDIVGMQFSEYDALMNGGAK